MKTEILAKCPACDHSLRVIIGRKSTARETSCKHCGASYDYSAWQLATPRSDNGGVSLRSFYEVELHPRGKELR